MGEVLITIITPCYNGEKFIETAIKSVLNQGVNNIEHIVVDDGSTDSTEEICRKYEGDLFKYIKIDNGGAGHARNVGMSYARGKWIAFLDSDDIYLHQCFNSEFVAKLQKYEQDGADIIWTPKLVTDMSMTAPVHKKNAVRNVKHHMSELEFWTGLYRKSFIDAHKIKFYEYPKQDIESAFRYLTASSTDNIVVDNDMGFYLQRINPMSNTHTWNTYVASKVKTQVYWDLYKNTAHSKDKDYLLRTIISDYITLRFMMSGKKADKKLALENKTLFTTICKDVNNYLYIRYCIFTERCKLLLPLIKRKLKEKLDSIKRQQPSDELIVPSYEEIKDRLCNIKVDVID